MLKKVLGKLRRNSHNYQKMKRHCSKDSVSMTRKEAIALLNNYHSDEGFSCIKEELVSSGGKCACEADRTFQGVKVKDVPWMLDIIVPVYNMEKYVEECVDSLLQQNTSYAYRVILINDGSTDHSGEILEKYVDLPQILLIHQENKGLSGARNTGLLHATAPYITFVDSDDSLERDAVEKMLSVMEKTGVDLLAASYYNYHTFKGIRHNYRQKAGHLSSTGQITGHACGKFYRRELFEGLQFPENYWFEDSITHQLIFPRARKIYALADYVYARRANPFSITNTSGGKVKSIDTVWVTLRLLQDRKKLGFTMDQDYYEYLLDQIVLNQKRLQELKEEVQIAAFSILADLIQVEGNGYKSNHPEKKELEELIFWKKFWQFQLYCNFH